MRWWREALIVRGSGYWDPKWYLAHNADVAESSQKPLRHYVRYGASERRSPGPRFDAYAYWLLNPSSDPHPLLHYLRRSRHEQSRDTPLEWVDPNHPVLASGWFDTEWYRTLRLPFIAAGVHPYVDYVQFGEALGVSPSLLLSNAALRQLEPADKEFPCLLAHFVAHNVIADVRPHIDAVESSPDGPVIVPRAGRPSTDQGSVVAVIHAYYLDVLPEVLSHVRNVPPQSTIVIVISDDDRVDEVKGIVTDILGPDQPIQIVVSANRGRNFGPLVSDLVPVIRQHDYVLHLHTKKSVYSGSEQDRWRHHLYQSLAGSRPLVETILGMLDDEPALGIVYASTFEGVPHWAHHWLSNVGVGRELYRRLGLDPALVAGIVDYPVGGMFWARTTALDRLWGAGFSLSDFPAEPVANDGTLAHAIERSILDIARADDFDVVEIDMANRIWRKNWSGRRHLPTRNDLVDQFTRALPGSDLVTVDLFDTLVLRPSLSPSTLQRLAATRVAKRMDLDPEELLQRRLEAESNARHVVLGDVQVDDIVAAAPAGHHESVAALIDAEVELEADVCIPRPWLIDLLRNTKVPGRPLVLMSDTYLPRSCIDDLLAKIGGHDLFDEVVVSNEVRARKDSGAMWELVEERYGVARHRWLHLGDNEHSDVQIPRDRGIEALHVASPSGVADYHGIAWRQVDHSHRLATDLVIGLAATALYGDGHRWWDGASAARRFGWAGIGPMLWTYVTWLIQHPETRSADRLLFIARDGYLSHRLLERLRPLLSVEMPPSSYFLMSRCCALSIAQARGPQWNLLLGRNTYRGPLRDLVRHRLGTELPDDPTLDQEVVLPADFETARERLEPYSGLLVEQGRLDLVAFEEYMRSLGIGPEEKIILSDLGYSGTIQRCLELVLSQTFTGLYAATSSFAQETTGITQGAFADGVVLQHEDTVMGNGLLLEAVWAADHGQVIRFESTANGPVPILRQPDAIDEVNRQELREIQDAAIDFCMEVIDRFGPEIINQPVDTTIALKPFADLMSGGFTWANDVLKHLEVEGDFVGTGPSHVRKNRD